jgi:hypothetical protein
VRASAELSDHLRACLTDTGHVQGSGSSGPWNQANGYVVRFLKLFSKSASCLRTRLIYSISFMQTIIDRQHGKRGVNKGIKETQD